MKKAIIALILILCVSVSACAEGLLPSLTDTIGKAMPSLGEALGRYPDEKIQEGDGGLTEVFQGVTETDFNTFSVYLGEKGAALADYQTAGSSFSASIQVDGKTISFTYDTQTLAVSVTYPKGTYDQWLNYAKTQFESAVQLMDEGRTAEAMAVLSSIPNFSGYKPAAEYLEAHPELVAAAARIAKYSVGNYVTFGVYPQTSGGNDSTPIEWLVLEKEGNKVLLLSRYGMDAQPYNTEWTDITWEKCTLRTWLNNEFLSKAFTSEEQAAILTTAVDNSSSQGYSGYNTNGGNDTQDKVFLLSYGEAHKYLSVEQYNDTSSDENMKSRGAPTAYAIKQGAHTSSNKTEDGVAAGWWWLRSPGDYQRSAVNVDADGSLNYYGVDVDSLSVRPALWINLESDIF